jgi:hypothetical protein
MDNNVHVKDCQQIDCSCSIQFHTEFEEFLNKYDLPDQIKTDIEIYVGTIVSMDLKSSMNNESLDDQSSLPLPSAFKDSKRPIREVLMEFKALLMTPSELAKLLPIAINSIDFQVPFAELNASAMEMTIAYQIKTIECIELINLHNRYILGKFYTFAELDASIMKTKIAYQVKTIDSKELINLHVRYILGKQISYYKDKFEGDWEFVGVKFLESKGYKRASVYEHLSFAKVCDEFPKLLLVKTSWSSMRSAMSKISSYLNDCAKAGDKGLYDAFKDTPKT